jgi:hypothetical protein
LKTYLREHGINKSDPDAMRDLLGVLETETPEVSEPSKREQGNGFVQHRQRLPMNRTTRQPKVGGGSERMLPDKVFRNEHDQVDGETRSCLCEEEDYEAS